MSRLADLYRTRREVLTEIEALEDRAPETRCFELMCLFRDMLTETIRISVNQVVSRNTTIQSTCEELADDVLSAEVIQ